MLTIEKRSEDLLIALFAELAIDGIDTIPMGERKFHDRFGHALERLSAAGGELKELASQFYKNVVTDTYDELDHSLITAEQFGFVKFPNPSYTRLTIAITPRMAHRLLKDWNPEERAAIHDAAKEIMDRQLG